MGCYTGNWLSGRNCLQNDYEERLRFSLLFSALFSFVTLCEIFLYDVD